MDNNNRKNAILHLKNNNFCDLYVKYKGHSMR